MRVLSLRGYFAQGSGRPVSVDLSATISDYGMGELLTIDLPGRWRLTVPFHAVAELCRALRAKRDTPELSGRVAGTGREGGRCAAIAWMRRRDGFEMLTLELPGKGQVSLPFAPVESLVRAERRSRA